MKNKEVRSEGTPISTVSTHCMHFMTRIISRGATLHSECLLASMQVPLSDKCFLQVLFSCSFASWKLKECYYALFDHTHISCYRMGRQYFINTTLHVNGSLAHAVNEKSLNNFINNSIVTVEHTVTMFAKILPPVNRFHLNNEMIAWSNRL
jgi:hypothetical protein